MLSADFSDKLLTTIDTFGSKWRDVVSLTCQDGCIPAVQVRRLIQDIRDVNSYLYDLRVYVVELRCRAAHLTTIVVGTDIYNDVKRIASALDKFYDFVEKYVYVTDNDIAKLEKLTSEIDSITVGLMYAGDTYGRAISRLHWRPSLTPRTPFWSRDDSTWQVIVLLRLPVM